MEQARANIWQRKPWRMLSGTGLKWVAVATMLVDHVGAIILWQLYGDAYRAHDPGAGDLYQLYLLSRAIGRAAFPLFCFVLTEGFVHTHSKPKYALRLLGFAVVSEPFYDFALHDTISYTSQLNIMFTMLLAFCALWAGEALGKLVGRLVEKRGEGGKAGAHAACLEKPGAGWKPGVESAATLLFTLAALAGAAFLAGEDYLDVSYRAYRVILIGALYLARGCRPAQFALGALAGVWYCMDHSSWLQIWSVLGLACIMLYNGKRGRGMKYFFYLFYPLHLLAIKLVALWLL